MKQKRSKRVWIIAGISLLFGVGIVGGVLGLQPLATRLLHDQLPAIEKAVAQALGSDVRFGSIDVRIHYPLPEIWIENVRVFEEGSEPVFRVASVKIQLHLLESLHARKPRFGAVVLSDAEARIVERVPGQWVVQGLKFMERFGLEKPEDQTSVDVDQAIQEIVTWVGTSVSVRLEDTTLSVLPWEGAPLRLKMKEMGARWKGGDSARTEIGIRDAIVSGQAGWKSALSLRRVEAAWRWVSAERRHEIEEARVLGEGWSASGRVSVTEAQGWVFQGRIPALSVGFMRERISPVFFSKDLAEWLDRALAGGTFEEVRVEGGVGGAARSNPVLKIAARMMDVDLLFDTAWPRADQLKGDLLLEADRLMISAKDVRYAGMSVERIEVKIPDLSAAHPTLELAIAGRSEMEPLRTFLAEGPLRETWKPLLEFAEPSAPAEANLRLVIPLAEDVESPGVRGEVSLVEAGLRQKPWDLDLTRISGNVVFDKQSLHFEGIRGDLLGQPFELSGRSTVSPNGTRRTQFKTTAYVPVDRLAPHLERVPLDRIASGGSRARLDVEIEKHPKREHAEIQLSWESSLEGVEIRLPEPVGKPAPEALTINGQARFTGNRLNGVSFVLARSGDRPLSLEFRQKEESENTWSLTGALRADRFPVHEWSKQWSEWGPKKDEKSPGSLELSAVLDVDRLEWEHLSFKEARLEVSKKASRWTARVRSREVMGDVEFETPLPQNQLTADLRYVILPRLTPPPVPDGGEEDEVVPEPWNLKTWPSIELLCERLKLGETDYGKLRAKVRQTGESLVLDEFTLRGPELDFTAKRGGSVYDGDRPSSWMEGAIQIEKHHRKLEWESANGALLENGKIHFDATWPGAPNQFSLKKVSGRVKGYVQRGRVEGVRSFFAGLFNFFSLSWEDSRKQMMRFWRASFDIEAKDGRIDHKYAKALFGSNYVRVGGVRAPDGKLDMKARVLTGVEDIPDPSLPGNDNASDPEGGSVQLIFKNYRISGTWKDPSIAPILF